MTIVHPAHKSCSAKNCSTIHTYVHNKMHERCNRYTVPKRTLNACIHRQDCIALQTFQHSVRQTATALPGFAEVAAVVPEDTRPVWPSVVSSSLIGRLSHELQVDHICGTMPYTGAYAVCACVSTSNDYYILVLQKAGAESHAMCVVRPWWVCKYDQGDPLRGCCSRTCST